MAAARLAVWGLGRMGLRHAENVRRCENARLVGVSDLDGERAAACARELRTDAYRDLDELLEAAEPDGIVVATPAASHPSAIETAARRGVHVLCEKPLAFDGPAAAAALAAAKAASAQVRVGFQMRFDRDLCALAARVEDGELGRLYQLRASLRDVAAPSREYLLASGGYLLDGAIHCFDLARWLLGEVEEVACIGAALSGEPFVELGDVDNAIVTLRFASGALGVVDVSRVAAYGFDSAVEVLGERGAIRVPGGRADGLERCESGRVSWSHAMDFFERFEPAFASELQAFADLLAGEGDSGIATGEDGLAAMRIAAAAALSRERGGSVRVAEVPW